MSTLNPDATLRLVYAEGTRVDRTRWIAQRRKLNEERMDTLFAPDYDNHWGEVCPTHERMLNEFLGRCTPGGKVLDAACGTGKFWPIVLGSGRSVLGIDQSGGMLAKAEEKHPEVPTLKLGMQEMRFENEFDGVICVDAMEFVFPEDWPRVLSNFRHASKEGTPLYLTVELTSPEDIEEALEKGESMGLPVVEGEHAHEGGYHYYPPIEKARDWIEQAGFSVVGERTGDGYHHFLAVGN